MKVCVVLVLALLLAVCAAQDAKCKDKSKKCKKFKNLTTCSGHAKEKWLTNLCKETCGLCDNDSSKDESKDESEDASKRSECEDKNTGCSHWTSLCDSNYWVMANCKNTCNKCGCMDNHDDCPEWAEYHCDSHSFVQEHCQKSCGTCDDDNEEGSNGDGNDEDNNDNDNNDNSNDDNEDNSNDGDNGNGSTAADCEIENFTTGTTFKDRILAVHNCYRRQHKDTPDLVWSDAAATFAQKWCTEQKDDGTMNHSDGSGFGENLAMAGKSSGTFDPLWLASTRTTAWYDEIYDYSYSNHGFASNTGHFTQLVWKSTTGVGCGWAEGPRDWSGTTYHTGWVCCNYTPPGNYLNQFEANVQPRN